MTLLIAAAPAPAGDACTPGRGIERLPIPSVTGEFGNAMAAGPGLIAVGDPKTPPTEGGGSGSVTVYRRLATGWAIEAVITSPQIVGGDEFGSKLAIADNWLFVRSRSRAFAYFRDPANASPQWRLTPDFAPNASTWYLGPVDRHSMVISVPPNSYVLEPDAAVPGGWSAVAVLNASNGTPGAIHDELLATTFTTTVLVFRREGSALNMVGQIPLPEAYRHLPNRFVRVTTDGIRLAVTYPYMFRQTAVGWVDVYRSLPDGAGWAMEAHLEAPIETANLPDSFGNSVAISGDRLAVGSPDDGFRGPRTGAVYCYRFVNGTWRLSASHHGSSDDIDGQFGFCVAIEGDNLIATGSGFWSAVNPTVIPFCADAATDRTCAPGIGGLLGFVDLFLAGDLAADYTTDGALSPEDLFRFLADWFAGCPQ